MIKYVSGDLLQSTARYIAQGVAEGNQEGLGTGLALKISRKWPAAQTAFKKFARSGRFRGGDIWVAEPTTDHPGIIYLATQPDMYHATMPYLRRSLKKLAKFADDCEIDSIALPKIGAGLGKLSWIEDVKPLFEEFLSTSKCTFEVFEKFTTLDEAVS